MAFLSRRPDVSVSVFKPVFFLLRHDDTMKRSVFVILQRVDTGHILYVIDGWNKISLPGGKSEQIDKSQFATLIREFEEETKQKLPPRKYHHFQWGCKKHTIRIYYARINSRAADDLCRRDEIRQNHDSDEPIAEYRWLPPTPTNNMQHHIQHALRIWTKVDTRRKLF